MTDEIHGDNEDYCLKLTSFTLSVGLSSKAKLETDFEQGKQGCQERSVVGKDHLEEPIAQSSIGVGISVEAIATMRRTLNIHGWRQSKNELQNDEDQNEDGHQGPCQIFNLLTLKQHHG